MALQMSNRKKKHSRPPRLSGITTSFELKRGISVNV